MSSNYQQNKAAIEKFRKELIEMLGDVSAIDKKILDKVGNKTIRRLKKDTPVDTGFMRRSWKANPTIKKQDRTDKEIVNTADYASFVNDGHRVVNKYGETVGFVEGQHMLERALAQAEKELVQAFEEEIRRINKEHDK